MFHVLRYYILPIFVSLLCLIALTSCNTTPKERVTRYLSEITDALDHNDSIEAAEAYAEMLEWYKNLEQEEREEVDKEIMKWKRANKKFSLF